MSDDQRPAADQLEWELFRVRTLAAGHTYALRQEDLEALRAVLARLETLAAEVARLQGWEQILAAAEIRDRERLEWVETLEAENERLREAGTRATTALADAVTQHARDCASVLYPARSCDCWVQQRREALAALRALAADAGAPGGREEETP